MVIGMAWYMVWFMAWIMAWHGLHVVVLHSCEHDHDINHSPPFSQALTATLHVIVSIWMLLRVGLEVYTHHEAYEIYEELTGINRD